jgi:hypothetical protein
MNLLTKYADFYLDYDLQDPDNIASKQYLFIDPHTKRVTKRKPPLTYRRNDLKPQAISNLKIPAQSSKPTTLSSRYSKQNNKATHDRHMQTPQYIRKNHFQQTNSKVLLQKEFTPKTRIILQPQEETKPEDFPALPNSENKAQHSFPIHIQATHQNNQHQTRTLSQSQIDRLIQILESH